MRDYLYDGTFEGLLCCIYAHYYTEKAMGIYLQGEYQGSLLGGFSEIKTDEEKAMRVYRAIQNKISPFDLRQVYRAFLSCTPEKEMKILRYVCLGFSKGPCVSSLQGEKTVYDIQQASHIVGREVDRIAGLLRFSVLESGALYAKVDPDNDILELIAGHFADRLKMETFVIYDEKRKKAILSKDGNWYITAREQESDPGFSEDEHLYRELWKKYFATIAIKERINPRCQKTFMPLRYWKNLTEML